MAMLKRMLIMLGIVLVVFGCICAWKFYAGQQMKKQAGAMASAVATVTATTASNAVWHPRLHAVATLRAVQGTDVSPQMPGTVREIHFKSGQHVEQGELLVQLDVTVERAQLQGLEARAELAQTHLRRVQALSKNDVTTASELDQAQAELKEAQANVASQKQLIERKTIRAPFSGIAGVRQVSLGDYLSAGASIVTLQSLDPIYADFSLPQEEFNQVKEGQPVAFFLDVHPETTFRGTVTAINPKIAEATRNFLIRATITNRELRLRPGMFGEVTVERPEQQNIVTLPKTAISYNPYGDSVFIIHPAETNGPGNAALKVRRTFVQTGEERGTQVAIIKGVEAGQQVVTSGQMKLQEGSAVRINNQITPANQPSASPPDED